MKIDDPSEYKVTLEQTDIEILEKALHVLRNLKQEMDKRECTTAQGGWEDCPITYDIDMINNVISFLDFVCEDGITSIY